MKFTHLPTLLDCNESVPIFWGILSLPQFSFSMIIRKGIFRKTTNKVWSLCMNLIFYYIGSYLIGNFLTGQLIVKLFHKANINEIGSGNPGARNAGRLYGKKAFLVTFLGDALKGSIVILVGGMFDFTETECLIGLTLAVIGHIKPIMFRFKGGKGISTYIGGIITFAPWLALIIIIGFLVTYPFTKSFTISGLISFCFIPFSVYYYHHSFETIMVLIALTAIIVIAHRDNLFGRVKL